MEKSKGGNQKHFLSILKASIIKKQDFSKTIVCFFMKGLVFGSKFQLRPDRDIWKINVSLTWIQKHRIKSPAPGGHLLGLLSGVEGYDFCGICRKMLSKHALHKCLSVRVIESVLPHLYLARKHRSFLGFAFSSWIDLEIRKMYFLMEGFSPTWQ